MRAHGITATHSLEAAALQRSHAWRERGGGVVLGVVALVYAGLMAPVRAAAETPPNFTVAFIGDQGLTGAAQQVLQLIHAEGADAVLHSGDFDYVDDPPAWEAQIDGELGIDFPYFACVGNHDEAQFFAPGGYQERLAARMNRLGIPWNGNLGVQCAFIYEGIHFVLTAPGIAGSGHDTYIRDRFAASASRWRISSHHKVMHLMQPEGKGDDTGWGVYEEARKAGAMVATAHAHAYSRTHLLGNMQTQLIASTSSVLEVARDDPSTPQDEGASFAFVSGLGGKSIRAQEVSGSWFACIYTATQNAQHGALFGVFNYNGNAELAHFYFKNIAGQVIDAFYVHSLVSPVVSASGGTGAGSPSVQLEARGGARRRLAALYRLPTSMPASLDVFDVRGRLVVQAFRDAPHAAGEYRWEWDGHRQAAGVYFLQLRTPAVERTVRTVLLP